MLLLYHVQVAARFETILIYHKLLKKEDIRLGSIRLLEKRVPIYFIGIRNLPMVSFCYLGPKPRLVDIDTAFFSFCPEFLRYRMMHLISLLNRSPLECSKILPHVRWDKIPKLGFLEGVKSLEYFYPFYGFVQWTRDTSHAHQEHAIRKKIGGAKKESANLKSGYST